MDRLTVRLLRPRNRRRFNTFCPSGRNIRLRKPCTRRRRRVLGCHVRLTISTLLLAQIRGQHPAKDGKYFTDKQKLYVGTVYTVKSSACFPSRMFHNACETDQITARFPQYCSKFLPCRQVSLPQRYRIAHTKLHGEGGALLPQSSLWYDRKVNVSTLLTLGIVMLAEWNSVALLTDRNNF